MHILYRCETANGYGIYQRNKIEAIGNESLLKDWYIIYEYAGNNLPAAWYDFNMDTEPYHFGFMNRDLLIEYCGLLLKKYPKHIKGYKVKAPEIFIGRS